MRISALCTAVVTYVVVGHPPVAMAQVDQQLAQEYFKEAQALCERDGGRLWGVSICAPMVIADRRTQTFGAETGDATSNLKLIAPVRSHAVKQA